MTNQIKPADGKLGILLVGLGAVSTTFVAGIEAAKKNLSQPTGSFTQMGAIEIGKGSNQKKVPIQDFIPLAQINDLCFAAWDLFPDNAYEAAVKAQVVPAQILEQIKEPLQNLKPFTAVQDKNYVRKLEGTHVKSQTNKMELAEAVIKDINDFKTSSGCSRLTMIWCGSTEAFNQIADCHKSIKAFEEGLRSNDPAISPSMIYAYAALKSQAGYANGAPNLTTDCPALEELAREMRLPISGKDFKTGQTLMKTILAPGLAARYLDVTGWFSTNILGNRDGEVLDDPVNFKTKEESKLSVLESILDKNAYKGLYENLYHKVRIEYYPPRGDNKEGWDNIDIKGWLDMPMQIKINFLCRDSILAAPLVLDLVLFMDLAQRAGFTGTQEWLSFFYKAPMVAKAGDKPVHDLFVQNTNLKNTLRQLMGEETL